VVNVSIPKTVHAVIPTYQVYLTLPDWFANLTLLKTSQQFGRWIPQSWSLPVEVWFYVFMALGLARGGVVLGVWIAAAVGYVVWIVSMSPTFRHSTPDRYFPLAAAALPFALGSLACWLRPSLPRFSRAAVVAALLAFWSHMLLAGRLWSEPMSGGFYVSLALAFLVVVALHEPPMCRRAFSASIDGSAMSPIHSF
jgi:peptidoglycan/LPS O-acetylase OafA/YrhL